MSILMSHFISLYSSSIRLYNFDNLEHRQLQNATDIITSNQQNVDIKMCRGLPSHNKTVTHNFS